MINLAKLGAKKVVTKTLATVLSIPSLLITTPDEELQLLVESSNSDGSATGTSCRYAPIRLENASLQPGNLRTVRVVRRTMNADRTSDILEAELV